MRQDDRFERLENKLKEKGSKHPAALAAWIGRKKYGEKGMEKLEREGEENVKRMKKEG